MNAANALKAILALDAMRRNPPKSESIATRERCSVAGCQNLVHNKGNGVYRKVCCKHHKLRYKVGVDIIDEPYDTENDPFLK